MSTAGKAYRHSWANETSFSNSFIDMKESGISKNHGGWISPKFNLQMKPNKLYQEKNAYRLYILYNIL